jgi:hypothetical protein
MRRSAAVIIVVVILISCAVVVKADSQDWQWPDKLNIAGFSISDIKGTVRPDGSGSANGTLSLGSLGNQQISLSRTSNGDISGSVNLKVNASGADIQGKMALSGGGLEGRGTIGSSPKPISDASISFTPNGQASGTGRVSLGGTTISAQFEIGRSFSVSGSKSVRKQADTPLALYSFNGTLDLRGASGKISILANGEVQRTGKVAKQVNTQNVSDVEVDPNNGQAVINFGGVNVTFKFF